ncbi:hypothetical protein OHA72_56930 [Dactylosporangium sp. NBC_01737]|uniref:hypothetical protein n=1 Tax=Dactylosporangium sp. NBC_01737 TaxID=2975959 RepID=UPI002E144B68|nr:hypothetical protein OHA72_56930 [Dactylosporangium sp. NBC_01737]
MRDFGIDDQHHPSAEQFDEDAVGAVTFSQDARLELDDLLEELMLRARDVQDTQGRLRGLLRAFLAVARADSLDSVLRHVVEAARELVDARCAALGVVDRGRLTRFVHTGMDTDVVSNVGHLPDGKGLLGLLVAAGQDRCLSMVPPVTAMLAGEGPEDKEGTMKRSAAGWFLAEFGIAFVAGVVGAMIAAHRHAGADGAEHHGTRALAQEAEPDLLLVS